MMAANNNADARGTVKKVIEYLSKKGFSRTEAMLRMESEKTDENGRPLIKTIEDSGAQKYLKAFGMSRSPFVEGGCGFIATEQVL